MSRIRCSPCEIVALPVCDCCTEELCFCSKNTVELSCAPCVCNPRGPYVGAKVPMLIEGWVSDDQFTTAYGNHTIPGPFFSSLGNMAANLPNARLTPPPGISWDIPTTLFSYAGSDFSQSTKIHLNSTVAGGFTPGSFGLTPGFNDHIAPMVNVIVNELLMKDFNVTVNTPYNSEIFYILKDRLNLVYDSLSTQAKNFISDLAHKSPSTYYFGTKYINQLAKSILIGELDTYFPSDKMSHILSSSEELYKDRSVPELSEEYSTNLENAKEYIAEHRLSISPHIRDGHLNQSVPDNTLRKFWKVVPSDTDQRVRVYRIPQIVRTQQLPCPPYGIGTCPQPVVTGTNVSPSSIMSVNVNDDDTITVYRQDRIVNGFLTTFSPARAHYIKAEILRVFNVSSYVTTPWPGPILPAHGHLYRRVGYNLDPAPRQLGCECLSGCHMRLCSDRDRSYVFDPQDRTVLLGLLGGVSGVRFDWSPDEPYIDLTISSPLNNNYSDWDEIDFSPPPHGRLTDPPVVQPDYTYYNSNAAWGDFYLLTPNLSGTDLLSSIIPEGTNSSDAGDLSGYHTNPYIRKTELTYKVRTKSYGSWNKNLFDFWMGFRAGPGNVFFVDHNDPIVKYLNRAAANCQEVSATMADLNIDNILGEGDVYPRRIPYHIVIIPTDSNSKWNPFGSTSRITRMIDPTDSLNFNYQYNNGYIQRTLRMIPAPRRDVLDSNYLELASMKSYPFGPPYQLGNCTRWSPVDPTRSGWESTKYPNGSTGTENDPLRMLWKGRTNVDLGPSAASGISSYSIQSIFRTFSQAGYEIPNSRKTDPVAMVFDWITKIKYMYDTRTGVTYSAGLVNTDVGYNPYHPVNNPYSIPKFDVWRHLNIFEFHEFLLKFDNEFFSTFPRQLVGCEVAGGLIWNRFRDVLLFDSLAGWPELTYLHKYAPNYTRPWAWGSSPGANYGGNQYNFRNAAEIAEMEQPKSSLNKDGVVMDEKDPGRYY